MGRTRTWIELINCPDGNDSENLACKGAPAPWNSNRFLSYNKMVNYALKNYGCNCFSDNKRVSNVFGKDYMHPIPGINGEPLDELDKACSVLARRNKCLNIDNEDKNFETILQDRKTCDYIQGYSTFVDQGGNVQCGHERNPHYISDSDFFQANEPFYNINRCRGQVCAMDKEFAESIAHLLLDPFQFWLDNYDKYYVFDDEDVCVKRTNNMLDSCCGAGFQRFPYNSEEKRCCVNRIVEKGSIEESFYC